MISRKLYRTFQSLVVHRTATVTSTGRELSVAISSIELDQSMRCLYCTAHNVNSHNVIELRFYVLLDTKIGHSKDVLPNVHWYCRQ